MSFIDNGTNEYWRVNSNIPSTSYGQLVNGITYTQNYDGSFNPVQSTSNGNVRIALSEPLTAFGEVRTAMLTPIIQYEFAYLINTRQWFISTTGSSSVGITNSKASLVTGSTSNSTVSIESKRRGRYRGGQGIVSRFTGVWPVVFDGDNWAYLGIFDEHDGYGFGYMGQTFGILYRSAASGAVVDTFIPQTLWNVDCADGTKNLPLLNTSFGNVFEIQFQFLGFGQIRFYIEHPATGLFELVHQIDYANSATLPSLANASLPLRIEISNGTTTNNCIIESASMGMFNDGPIISSSINDVFQSTVNISTTEAAVFSIQNKAVFGAHNNHLNVFLTTLTAAASSNGSRIIEIRLYRNYTLVTPIWADVDTGSSCLEEDYVGTLGNPVGELIFTQPLANNTTITVDLTPFNLFIAQGERLTVTAVMTTGSGELSVALVAAIDL